MVTPLFVVDTAESGHPRKTGVKPVRDCSRAPGVGRHRQHTERTRTGARAEGRRSNIAIGEPLGSHLEEGRHDKKTALLYTPSVLIVIVSGLVNYTSAQRGHQ